MSTSLNLAILVCAGYGACIAVMIFIVADGKFELYRCVYSICALMSGIDQSKIHVSSLYILVLIGGAYIPNQVDV